MTFGVLGGLAAAVCWSTAGLCAALAGRRIGVIQAVAWANVVAVVLASVVALAVDGIPHDVHPVDLSWVLVLGICTVGALLCAFRSMSIGPVGLISPVISTEGAIAALIGVATGDSLGARTGAALAVIVFGVLLAATELGPAGLRTMRGASGRALVTAIGAAVFFGVTLAFGRRADGLGPIWTVAGSRAVALAIFTIPVLVRRGLRWPRAVWHLILINAAADVTGYAIFIRASRDTVAVPSVLASQYATITVIVGVVAFRERLRAWQWLGIALTIAGTAVVAATTSG